MKLIITILLLITNIQAKSETRDLNIYGTYPGVTFSVEFNIEYSIYNTQILDIESTTYLKYGSAVFGFQGIAVVNSYPIIGFVQYFGLDKGVDIGASYFRKHIVSSYDSEPSEPHFKETEQLLGFEIGYRDYFSDNAVFRFTFSPFYSLDNPPVNLKFLEYFQYMISVSLGYSF